tara:strand:- start:82 stop:384 length:303 start_codon:yes stop_codon:yes gene_type:complete
MSNTVYVKVGGVWKTATNYYVNVGGTWKEGDEIGVKVGSTWEYPSAVGQGLPTVAQALGFDILSFVAPITNVTVDSKSTVNSLKFDVLGFVAPIAGGMSP